MNRSSHLASRPLPSTCSLYMSIHTKSSRTMYTHVPTPKRPNRSHIHITSIHRSTPLTVGVEQRSKPPHIHVYTHAHNPAPPQSHPYVHTLNPPSGTSSGPTPKSHPLPPHPHTPLYIHPPAGPSPPSAITQICIYPPLGRKTGPSPRSAPWRLARSRC